MTQGQNNKSDGRIKSGKLAGLSMWGAIWVLAWPALIESFLNALVSLVDTALAAGLSEEATTAIGVAAYISWAILMGGMAIGIGITALVARAVGRGRIAAANSGVGQGILIALTYGSLAGALLYFIAPGIATFLQLENTGPGSGYELAVTYLKINAFAVPAMTVCSAALASLRAAGDTLRPMFAMVTVNIVNIALSFILSGADLQQARPLADGSFETVTRVVNPFTLDMDVAGIAWGTFWSWTLGAAILLAMLTKGAHGVRLRAKRLRPHLHTMRRIVRVSVPGYIEMVGMWVGTFLVLSMIGFMGDENLYGAHAIAVRIESFSFLPGFAMGMAAATLVGQYLGAQNHQMATKAASRCTMLAGGIMGLMGLAFILFPHTITGLFSPHPYHMEVVPPLLVMCGFFQIPFGVAGALRGALRGAGDVKAAMVITWFCTYGLRMPLAWLFSGVTLPLPASIFGPDAAIPNPAPLQNWLGFEDLTPLAGLWVGLGLEIWIRGIIFTYRFLSGKWKSAKV